MASIIVEQNGESSVVIGPLTANGSFLELTDTDNSYAGKGGYTPAVRQDELGVEFVPALGTGDMTKATYDITNSGIVDNAEALGGELPAFYAPQTEVTLNTNYRVNPKESLEFVAQVTPPIHSTGQLFYNSVEKALAYQTDIPNVTLNIGSEHVIRVINNTGDTILNGKPVRHAGVASGLPQIQLAQANSFLNATILGIATHDIATGTEGYITTSGVVHDIDTSALTVGLPIYLSETVLGGFTNTAPAIVSQVGGTLISDISIGEIQVSIINNGNLPTVFGGMQGQVTPLINVTTVAQDVVNYTLEDTVVTIVNTTTGVITLPNDGGYRCHFSASITFPEAVTTRSVTLELYDVTGAVVTFPYTKNIPRNATADAFSFSWPFNDLALHEYKMRIRASESIAITFAAISFDIASISLA